MYLKASTKAHIHKKIEIFWTKIASTMAYPNPKNGPKNGLRPLGVNNIKTRCVILQILSKPSCNCACI